MNEHVTPSDPFHHWRTAIATGKKIDTQPGSPRAGYYRNKDEAVAFLIDDASGGLYVWRSGSFPIPKHPDTIDELFAWCAPHPVSWEDFSFFVENKRWPDEVAPVEIDPDLPPHERADAELTAQRKAMADWISEIGTVKTQEQATKAGNFADFFAKVEKSSEDARKAEKEPHLEAGRAVDAKWQPVVKRAGELKTYAKRQTEAFLIAERNRILAEENAAREAAAKAAREAEEARRQAEATGAPPPVIEAPAPPPPPAKAKAGKVHLRTRTVHTISDMRAVLEYLAKMNNTPADLIEVVQRVVNRLREAGVEVPGVETKTVETAQ